MPSEERRTRFPSGGLEDGVTPSPTARLAALGWELPPPPSPKGSYTSVVVHGGTAFVAGQIVTEGGAVAHPGLVDRDVSPEVARELARRAMLQGLSALAATLGSLDRVARIVRVGVFVASSPGFVRQHEVANGATDLLVDLFGPEGRPVRAAVGVAALPLNAPVEVEIVAAVG
jgi:enamine deaminase RidA (YjgF/YER057c/UK114 family)